MPARRRKPASKPASKPVKTTLSMDVDTHSRLCAMASKRRLGISELAMEFVRIGLRGVSVSIASVDPGRGRAGGIPTEEVRDSAI